MWYSIARTIVGLAFRVVWRPTIIGRENIPRTGPVIFASNHLSFIDSVIIPLVVPRRVRFMAKAEYFYTKGPRGRVMAMFFRTVDAIPVRRQSQRDSLDALDLALGVLREGTAFGIYPEGTRSRDGRLYRGKTGVAWLAMASGALIVPVTLTGTNKIQPIGARMLRIQKARIVFGKPVDPAPWIARVAAEGGAGRARREITDEVMERIASVCPQPLAGVYNDPPKEDPGPE